MIVWRMGGESDATESKLTRRSRIAIKIALFGFIGLFGRLDKLIATIAAVVLFAALAMAGDRQPVVHDPNQGG